MSDDSDRRLPADARVGLLGSTTGPVAAALRGTGVEPVVVESPDALPAVDAVVTLGESVTVAVGRTCPSVPVLPIESGEGFRSAPESTVDAAVDDLVEGRWSTVEHPVVALSVDGDRVRAAMDAMLVTESPARISEYAVHAGDREVASVRADGVVVALPAGSHGYARDAGGPVVALETGVAAVVPVSPFATDADHWVLPIETLSLTVERDETPVELLADDRTVGPVDSGTPVTVGVVGSFRTVVVESWRSLS